MMMKTRRKLKRETWTLTAALHIAAEDYRRLKERCEELERELRNQANLPNEAQPHRGDEHRGNGAE